MALMPPASSFGIRVQEGFPSERLRVRSHGDRTRENKVLGLPPEAVLTSSGEGFDGVVGVKPSGDHLGSLMIFCEAT